MIRKYDYDLSKILLWNFILFLSNVFNLKEFLLNMKYRNKYLNYKLKLIIQPIKDIGLSLIELLPL
jgi:hypothetical protein